MANVKPGDFAKVVSSPSLPEAVGLLVEVESPFGLEQDGTPLWICKALSGSPAMAPAGVTIIEFSQSGVMLKKQYERGYVMPGESIVIPDSCLKRIDPDEKPEEVLRTLELET